MAKPGFWRNVGGAIVNTFLSPGTTPYGPNGKYNKTLLRNGLVNLAAGAVNPIAGRLSQLATSQFAGGAAQEAGQQGWQWLAKQPITGDAMSGMPVDYSPVAFDPSVPQMGQPGEPSSTTQQPAQGQMPESSLAQMLVPGVKRDGRSGRSAGSSVLAEGQAAQDAVHDMQLSAWLGTKSPYKFRGMQ